MNYIFYNSIGYVIIIKQLLFIIIKFANIVRMTLLIFIMYLFQEWTLDTSYIVEWPCFYLVQIRLKFDFHYFDNFYCVNVLWLLFYFKFYNEFLLLILLSPSFPSAKSPWLGWQAPEQSCSLLVNITHEYIKIKKM